MTATINEEAVQATIDEVAAAIAAATGVPPAVVEPPKVVDPLGTDGAVVKTGDVLTADQVNKYVVLRRSEGSCGQRCAGVPRIGAYGYCQRKGKHGPELPHLVITADREVAWAWQNGEVPVDPEPDVLNDPATASVERFTQGLRVNYRNKREILFVLSTPRKKDEQVEVLDLTHQRFRKIVKSALVPARDDDPEPSPEEMAWVATFIADRRSKALEIGLRELENGRWDRNQMNESLAKIDIAPRPIRYGTSFSATVDLTLPEGVTTINEYDYELKIREAIKAAVEGMEPGLKVRKVREVYGGRITEIRG